MSINFEFVFLENVLSMNFISRTGITSRLIWLIPTKNKMIKGKN